MFDRLLFSFHRFARLTFVVRRSESSLILISICVSQFLFIEGAEVPQIGTKPYKVKEAIKPVSPTRAYSQTNVISSNSLNYNNGNSTLILYDSAVQSEGGNYRSYSSGAVDVCERPIGSSIISYSDPSSVCRWIPYNRTYIGFFSFFSPFLFYELKMQQVDLDYCTNRSTDPNVLWSENRLRVARPGIGLYPALRNTFVKVMRCLVHIRNTPTLRRSWHEDS